MPVTNPEHLTFAEVSRGQLDQVLDARKRYAAIVADKVRDDVRPQRKPQPVATPVVPKTDTPLTDQIERQHVLLNDSLQRARNAFGSQPADVASIIPMIVPDSALGGWETRHLLGRISPKLTLFDRLKTTLAEARELHRRTVEKLQERDNELAKPITSLAEQAERE